MSKGKRQVSSTSLRGGREAAGQGALLHRGGDAHDPGIPGPPSLSFFGGAGTGSCRWGHSAHPALPGCEVDVLRGHGAGHGEVLEDGGEEEE